MRPSVRAAALLLIAITAMAVIAPAARAETSYRYWTYWSVQEGAWSFATMGPASAIPVDGSVEGWRFTVATAAGKAQNSPQSAVGATAFDDVCGTTTTAAGMKRVAMVVDFGLPDETPPGESAPTDISTCIVAKAEATGYEMLRSITSVRIEEGLVCGIDGYPLTECAEIVDTTAMAPTTPSAVVPAPVATVQPETSSNPNGPLVTGLVVLLAAGIGYLAWRGRGKP